MGQCYSVDLRVKILDPLGFVKATERLLEDNPIKKECMYDFKTMDKTPLNCIRFMFAAIYQGELSVVDDPNGFVHYRNVFNATYSWESLLADWWTMIEPYVAVGSSIAIYTDTGRLRKHKIDY